MQVVTIDFETFWDTDFSLSKISFMEYIQSERFETISVSIKVDDGETETYFGDKVGPALRAVNWKQSAAVAHNGNEFDFPLLVWKYDCHPTLFIDTLCLARPKHQSDAGGSLAALSKLYGLREKDNSILLSTKGKHLDDFDLREMVAMATYNKGDVDNTRDLYDILGTPDTDDVEDLRMVARITRWFQRELLLSDMTARMICYPKFVCDTELLAETARQAELEKKTLLRELASNLGVVDTDELIARLGSSAAFASMLRDLDVEPPRKVSKTTGKETYAFAKTDPGLAALAEHPDSRVQALVAARLGVKSTLLETRIATMEACAQAMQLAMPIPLAYHSATTGRWGGRVWNPQNLPRIPRDKEGNIVPKLTNALRMALRAPKGHKVVVSDLSGIELRVNHFIWGVASSIEMYKRDPQADLYRAFAAKMYHIDESAVTKDQRQLAKVAQLGLGFGAGAKTFKTVAKTMGGITLTDEEAKDVVDKWRAAYREITYGWLECQNAVRCMHRGTRISVASGLVETRKDKLYLPSGRPLYYPKLREETGPDHRPEHKYGEGRKTSKIYGGLLCENIVQAIARDVIAEQALKIWKMTGRHPAHTVHDELVYVVPEDDAESFLALLNAEMRTPPKWLPDIVLWSEGDVADSYGEAK